ncbi:lasso RiPP family leader peptide-containing protein [Amycolatopsis sp. VS8301801F10]
MDVQDEQVRELPEYTPPALVEVGEFSDDTLGFGGRLSDTMGFFGS